MLTKKLQLSIDVNDEEFNLIYPESIRKMAQTQWTPVDVAKMAAMYLVEKPGTKALDIGSGIGKFCMIGASCTDGQCTGAEQRENLVAMANEYAAKYEIENARFIHSNIIDVPFTEFEAFYFFNAFYENIDRHAVIDNTIERGIHYYNMYTSYVSEQLTKMPVGTKVGGYILEFT